MSTPTEGGRALLRGRVLGFPVHLDLSFVVVVAFLGYFSGAGLRFWLLWLLIAPLAILAHELGHAVAARAYGASPQIALVGFGGVTTFTPPQPLSRVRSLVISLAGPFVGLALGLLALLVDWVFLPGLDRFGWQSDLLGIVEFTCLGWSVLNLLPVLPLDGGQAMRELLPGSEPVRGRRAAMVSVVTAAIVALVALLLLPGAQFLGIFMLFFCLTNILALRDSGAVRPAPAGAAPADGVAAGPEQAVVALLWRSDAAGARRLMESLPAGTELDLAVRGAVLSLTGEPGQGHALLLQEVTRRPGDPNAAALLLLTQALEHDWDAVLATLQGPAGRSVPLAVVERAVEEARFTGREDVAGRITVLAPAAAPVPPGPPAQGPPPQSPPTAGPPVD